MNQVLQNTAMGMKENKKKFKQYSLIQYMKAAPMIPSLHRPISFNLKTMVYLNSLNRMNKKNQIRYHPLLVRNLEKKPFYLHYRRYYKNPPRLPDSRPK